MGHLVGKDLYRALGRKIDGLEARTPWNQTFYAILRELYTAEEAELVVRMPYGLATLDEIVRVTGQDSATVEPLLKGLAEKGLVMDVFVGDGYRYAISALVIGIFELTMMRTRGELNMKEWAGLFRDYFADPDTFYKSNFGRGQRVSPLRALPHDGTVSDDQYVEVLDYEKASAIVDGAKKFAIGICSCRHEKLHTGEKRCQVPLETCSTFGPGVDTMVRHGFGREVSKTEMQENLARSRELGLVLCADNVKKDVSFICHCCGCCCNVLLGISKLGYPGVLVTSNYMAHRDPEVCTECDTCVESCAIGAIAAGNGGGPEVDEQLCVGCGVCALKCDSGAMRLVKRPQRVLHPEDTFERIILQYLEQGNLQNLMFSNPQSRTHGFMRAFVGGFLRLPPVKKALLSDRLRSSFLQFMRR